MMRRVRMKEVLRFYPVAVDVTSVFEISVLFSLATCDMFVPGTEGILADFGFKLEGRWPFRERRSTKVDV